MFSMSIVELCRAGMARKICTNLGQRLFTQNVESAV